MGVVVGVLLVLAGVAVVRNVLFFFGDDTPPAAEEVASRDLGTEVDPPVAPDPRPVGPPEAQLHAWRLRGNGPVGAVVRDPFHRVQRRGLAPAKPRLQGVLTAAGRTTALVDNTPVAVGERLGDGEVAEISPNGVRLATPGGELWLEFQPWAADVVANGGD